MLPMESLLTPLVAADLPNAAVTADLALQSSSDVIESSGSLSVRAKCMQALGDRAAGKCMLLRCMLHTEDPG